jgi:hypothetical protein
MDHQADDMPTQDIELRAALHAEVERLVAQLREVLRRYPGDGRHQLLRELAGLWAELPATDPRFPAAQALLTLDQRDVWFLADQNPVRRLDRAASELLLAMADAITAAGANFFFDAGEPAAPAQRADAAYTELGDAIAEWKSAALYAGRSRQQAERLEAASDER